MSGPFNLMETFKMPVVYSVKDTVKGSIYYFIQPLNEKMEKIFASLTKSNSKVKTLSEKEREFLQIFYPNDNLLTTLEENVKKGETFAIIPFFLNKEDSILDVKRKVMSATGYYYNDIHLWADVSVVDNKTSKRIAKRYGISGEDCNKYTKMRYMDKFDFLKVETKMALGIEYETGAGIELLHPNPKKISDETPPVAVIDTSTRTLGSYNIKNNHVFMMDFLSYREKHPSETEKNLQILRLFFPKSNEEADFREENTAELKRITEKMISLSRVPEPILGEDKPTLVFGEIGFNNLVIQVNRPANVYRKSGTDRDINLQKIFEKMELSEQIPYVRYRDIDRKYFTRVASDKLINVYHDGEPIEFKEIYDKKYKLGSSSYTQEYLPGLKSTRVSKREILSWGQTPVSYRERGELIRDRELVDSTDTNLVSELLLKVKIKPNDECREHPFFQDNYLTLVIKRSGHVYIKFLENKGDIPFDLLYCLHLNSIIGVIEDLNKLTRDQIPLFLPEKPRSLTKPTNMEYTTFDANISSIEIDIEKPLPFKRLSKNLKSLVSHFFDFRVIHDTDEIKMRYKNVEHFQSFANIRNHFLKLRKIVKSPTALMETFLLDCENLFNLTPLEATRIIEVLRDELETEPNAKVLFYNDLDIEVEIKRLEDNIYSVRILGCSSLGALQEIMSQISNYFNRCLIDKTKTEGTTKAEAEAEAEAVKVELSTVILPEKRKTFTEHDAAEFMEDSDVDEFSDYEEDDEDEEALEAEGAKPAMEGEEAGGGSKETAVKDADNSGPDEDSVSKLMEMETKSMRQFMPALRKAVDRRLFVYPRTNEHEQYSRLCAAVDNRQPIILTQDQWIHFERVNPVAFSADENIHLRWGSDKNNMNYYICPRIFCFNKRCMMPLTALQLIESDGKCFNCGNGVITENMITSNSSVYIRRGQKKKYWAETSKKTNAEIKALKKKFPEKWAMYLADTEKLGIPGFIDPKSHPENLCMPCCYSSNEPTNIFNNTDKCVDHPVDYYKLISTTSEAEINKFVKTLMKGSIITIRNKEEEIDYELETGNQVLVSAGKKFRGVYKITDTGSIKLSSYTIRELNRLFPNMTFTIGIDSSEGYKRMKLTPDMTELNEDTSLVDDSDYVINWNRRPIPHLRKGKLPVILNTLFANNLTRDIKKGKFDEGARRVVVREGSINNSRNSFITAIAHITLKSPQIDLTRLLEFYIKDLTLEDFVSANNGDLILQFGPNLDNEELKAFLIKTNFVGFKRFLSDNREYLKYNPDEITKIERLTHLVNTSNALRYNFFLYHAFEFFKKYLGDQNIYKDYKLLWNLFSKKTPDKYSVEKKGIDKYISNNNILILEYSKDAEDNEKVKLLTPMYADTITPGDESKYTMLLKFTDNFTGDDYFETLFVDEYLKMTVLHSRTLADIPKFLHKLIRELTNKCVKHSNELNEVAPAVDALLMGKSHIDRRLEFLNEEKKRQGSVEVRAPNPSMRLYEDHELMEFINDFFSRNRNIFANIKYTYPNTLEMYPDELKEVEYRETPTAEAEAPEEAPAPAPAPPEEAPAEAPPEEAPAPAPPTEEAPAPKKPFIKRKSKKKLAVDNSDIPPEYTGPYKDKYLKGSMTSLIKRSKKIKPVIDACTDNETCLGVTQTGEFWSGRTSKILRTGTVGEVSYVKGEPILPFIKRKKKKTTTGAAEDAETEAKPAESFINTKKLEKKSKKNNSAANNQLKKTVKAAVDKAAVDKAAVDKAAVEYSGPHENQYLPGILNKDKLGLLEDKKRECSTNPECKGLTTYYPHKGDKFKMRVSGELKPSPNGEISYVKL